MKLTRGQRFTVGLNYFVALLWAAAAVTWLMAGWGWMALIPIATVPGFIFAGRMWTKTYRSMNESQQRIRESRERIRQLREGLQ